ncbi:MAG: lipid-A-disaccharide synthase N-terminal domain-containing protein, partial [Alphaproteobacteria bacterium]|nr:lipid-A-disaccharide synthase N-terminal domain-containing protein [Alphaproteobacteria bacterium]
MIEPFLSTVWTWLSGHLNGLVLFGLVGQLLFTARFIVQWLHSEKVGRSAVPEIFWLFSIGGGFILLIYAILKNDFVFIVGQSLGLFIYARNIFFIQKNKTDLQKKAAAEIVTQLTAQTARLAANANNPTAQETKAAAEALQLLS